MEFKDRLKTLRQQKGLSQEALAKEIYVSRSAIAKWESGLGIPNDSNVKELCKYFDVEEDWLLDRQDLKKQINITKSQKKVIVSVLSVFLGFLLVVTAAITGIFIKSTEESKSMVQFGGWGDTLAISTIEVNGITLTGEEGSEFVCSTSSNNPKKEGCFIYRSTPPYSSDTPVTVSSGTTIFWSYHYSDETGSYNVENGPVWLEFINRKGSKILGYAVVRVDRIAKCHYEPEVVKAVIFPKVNGEYQKITEERVRLLMHSVEN